MDIKTFFVTVLSGLIGTVAMTLVMYIYSKYSHEFTKVIHILGNMQIGERNYFTPSRNALIVGAIAHFGVGILFSFAYYLLWNWGIFLINMEDSIMMGIVSGVVSIIIWKTYLSFHGNPPQFSELNYFLALFIGHIVFAIVSVNVFQLIDHNPELWYQMKVEAQFMK